MSVAGIRSNRGDNYQTLVAFDWALTVLSDKDYDWLELDATSNPVDDVVVGKADGIIICCQCKKNQPDFKAWSIADLRGELEKAVTLLADNSQARVRFCSRSEFGTIAKLRESAAAYKSEDEYRSNLTNEHAKTDGKLAAIIADQDAVLSTYEFLNRTNFDISPDFDRMIILLHERLHPLASNSKAAFDVLWTKLDMLGGRIGSDNLSASARYRLTKKDLEDILHSAGAMLARAMPIGQLHASFARTSAIGRSWLRDISGIRISSSVVNDLLAAIDGKKRSVLLTGMPGSGKTCVLLSLQEALEKRMETRNDLVSLFIQSREYADLATAQERQAQGLPHEWVEQAARLADESDVVVIIDSLDVLSIAREHSVLTYFLTQIDQLLLAPRVTVVTACREFDRKYDRRIATRQWGEELRCPELDWADEIVPLLNQLGIDSTSIDTITRELIRNSRELALFVELARRVGSFDVVTSQSLAQRYLNTIVQDSPALGEVAMKSIEAIAVEMLNTRSLSIPRQRFNASQSTLRQLQSLNILQITHDDRLTFGHQTLLDVLVISGALRQGLTLTRFIQGLPAVPFVRPTIRNFVAQLAAGERREFRKQIRAVLTGSAAFHIRSLIAKSFVQYKPQSDDWPLIRDLRDRYPKVYRVIYQEAILIEWHYFWLNHLVPALIEIRDSSGLFDHVTRIGHMKTWKNEDTVGVLGFWRNMLKLDWLDNSVIAHQLGWGAADIQSDKLPIIVPLLEQVMSFSDHDKSQYASTVARCVEIGAIDDESFWRYVAGGIDESDVLNSNLGAKLYCKPQHFGDGNYLTERMVQSIVLLDIALKNIEQWSQKRREHYGKARLRYLSVYLKHTTYSEVHAESDGWQSVSRERILFEAVETSIFEHVRKNSDWWKSNRNGLCSSRDGALCYMCVVALTSIPFEDIDLIGRFEDIDLIGRLLCTRELLEFEISCELVDLIKATYLYLDDETQELLDETVRTVWEDAIVGDETPFWVMERRVKYISAIPCHRRSYESQEILVAYETLYGKYILNRSKGVECASTFDHFSYKGIYVASDDEIVRLLEKYNKHSDTLLAGYLSEASSRCPARFLSFLASKWASIPTYFIDEIMNGVVNNLDYRNGDLKPDKDWTQIEEAEVAVLANQVLDELERHPTHWRFNAYTPKVLIACANVIQDTEDAGRLVFLSLGFGYLEEESDIHGKSVDFITDGIDMSAGKIAEALMILTRNFNDKGIEFPELLVPTLRLFATKKRTAIRAQILMRLPDFQPSNPELSWELFHRCMQNPIGLWHYAAPFMYLSYRQSFAIVALSLEQVRREGCKRDMIVWGRISALSALNDHIEFSDLIKDLNSLGIAEAWWGAASVWTHIGNLMKYRKQCFEGIEEGLRAGGPHASAIVFHLENIFTWRTPYISVPVEILGLCFDAFKSDEKVVQRILYGFAEWLNTSAQRDPELALAAAEIYLIYVNNTRGHLSEDDGHLVQLVSQLFAEAEEREESDCGAMLLRVVAIEDMLLTLGLNSMNEWLNEAERY